MLKTFGLVALTVVVVAVGALVYMSLAIAWGERNTLAGRYYARSLRERRRFRRVLALHGALLAPVFWLLARMSRFELRSATLVVCDIALPKGTCTDESMQRALAYVPRDGDVFIATQMRSGTTLTQHLVFQVLTRGTGDLVAEDRALQAVSPWIESARSSDVARAATIGAERPSRILKTHLPATACPISSDARYVYVARHPASCFASCADYLEASLGPFAPDVAHVEEWFTGDGSMWWGAWPQHVAGWWQLSREHDNVLFVRFEDIREDIRAAASRIAAHLRLEPLGPEELDSIARQCGFEHMKAHYEHFEMTPPHLMQDGSQLFRSGSAKRHRDVDQDARRRIAVWSRAGLESADVPWRELYPTLEAD